MVKPRTKISHRGYIVADVLHRIENAIEGDCFAHARLTNYNTCFAESVLKDFVGARMDGACPANTRSADNQFHHLRLVVREDANNVLKP